MSKVWIWSDTHFNHDNILKYTKRPYDNITEMNEDMLRLCRERVSDEDVLINLGDFAYAPKHKGHMSFDEIFSQMPGYKIMVRGNHDQELRGQETPIDQHYAVNECYDYLEYKLSKKMRVVMCHYPLEVWRNVQHGWVHVHGHCHGTLRRKIGRRMDVGVDCLPDCGPVDLELIVEQLKAEPYDPQDRHGKDKR